MRLIKTSLNKCYLFFNWSWKSPEPTKYPQSSQKNTRQTKRWDVVAHFFRWSHFQSPGAYLRKYSNKIAQIERVKWKEFANCIKHWHKNACHKYELSLRWTFIQMIVYLDNFYIKIYVQKTSDTCLHCYSDIPCQKKHEFSTLILSSVFKFNLLA